MKKAYLLVHILLNALMRKVSAGPRVEVALLNYLFNNYNADALPSLPGRAVNLTFDLALRQLMELDEKIEIIGVNTWVRHYWQDPYLVWNASEWGGINSVTVAPDKIWKPDMTLYNNAEKDFQGLDQYGKTKITVYSNGNVVWLIPTILRSACKLDMSYFPFDVQTCPLTFGSWAYDQASIDLYPKNPTGDLSSLAKSGEFIINGFEANRVSEKFNCCPNPYVTLTFVIVLHRRAKFYLFKIILPGVLIALLSCFSFILPPLTGERAGLIITNFLSLSVYVLIVSDSVPPSSDTLPLLVKFYTILMSEIGLALMTNCGIIALDAKTVPVPNWVRVIFLSNHLGNLFRIVKSKFLSKFIIYEPNYGDDTSLHKIDMYMKHGDRNPEVSTFAQLNERLASQLKSTSNGTSESNHDNKNNKRNEINISELRNLYDEKRKYQNSEELNYLKQINEHLKIKSQHHNIRHEWEEVVRSIDKIFFVIFVCLILGSVIFIFSVAPKINF